MKYIIIALLILTTEVSTQSTEVTYNNIAEEYFLFGMRQYAHKDFSVALKSFQSSINAYPMNHRITASMIMVAKSQYALKNYKAAVIACDLLLLRFPSSEYREDALFTKGMCFYNQTDFLSAFTLMDSVYTLARQRLNKEHSIKVLEHIAAEFFEDQQIDSLINTARNSDVAALLNVVRIERLFANGFIEDVKSSIDRVLEETSDPIFRQRIERLRNRIERGNYVKVGVLLPFMNSNPGETPNKKIATEVLEGIQLALSEYEKQNAPGMVTIEIDVRDSERNSEKIREIITSFSENASIIGIIGPIFSDETITAASFAMEQRIPLISPTATDDSVAMTGEYIFQANSPSSIRGKILAQYAINVLGVKNIAVIASDAPFEKNQADSFVVEAKRLGGEVMFDRRYKRGEADLRYHFRELRVAASAQTAEYLVTFKGKMNRADVTNRMMSYGFSLTTIDSLIARSATINLSTHIGKKAKELADSLYLPTKKNIVYDDSLHYPVTSVDVIFSPISTSQQIGVISSQIAYFNIKAAILGTGEWNNIHELDMNRRYADGVIFGSDKWVEFSDRTNPVFMLYTQKFGKQISDNVLFGYDVMVMLIRLFNEGSLTREQFIESLSQVVHQPGLRNSITLQYRRVNSDLNILQYKNGSITKLRTYTYQP